jgi:hypothetical protein
VASRATATVMAGMRCIGSILRAAQTAATLAVAE